MSSAAPDHRSSGSSPETRVLDAAKRCCEQWGFSKVTIDDIAAASGVSRATLYRLFPGGKDVLFEALRVRELNEFFDTLIAEVGGADELEELVVRVVVTATRELRADEHLAVMLASEPGDILSQLTVDGVPRIINVATHHLAPLVRQFVDADRAVVLIDVLVRATISYFLAPSSYVDLGERDATRAFVRPLLDAIAVDHGTV